MGGDRKEELRVILGLKTRQKSNNILEDLGYEMSPRIERDDLERIKPSLLGRNRDGRLSQSVRGLMGW